MKLARQIRKGRSCALLKASYIVALLLLATGCVAMRLPGEACPGASSDAACYFGTERPWRPSEELASFLRRVREPSLRELGRNGEVEAYRLTLLHWRLGPRVFRVHVVENKLRWVAIEFGANDLAFPREGTEASPAWLESFARATDHLNLFQLAPSEQRKFHSYVLDGWQWVLEGVKQGRYYVTTRGSPDIAGCTKPSTLTKLKRRIGVAASTALAFRAENRRIADFGGIVLNLVGSDMEVRSCDGGTQD